MILNKKATSIIEAIIVMLIIVSWVTWMYHIFSESVNLSTSTTNKIQAIQIAKQWIEWFTNIRETNWILFSSDYENCWNTSNYDPTCIWTNTLGHTITNNKSYIIYKNTDNRRYLEIKSTDNYWNWTYIDDFKVWLDSNSIYTQTGIVISNRPIFTRELIINYIDTNWDTINKEDDSKIKVTSKVQRIDNTSTMPHIIKLEQIFTNWKK